MVFVAEPAACYNGELRLLGGASATEGRVEICQDRVWGLICMNLWDDNDATVVCRQLGFSDQGRSSCVLASTYIIFKIVVA